MWTAPIASTGNIDMTIRIINYEDGAMYYDVGYVKQRRNQRRLLGNKYFAQKFYTAAARAALREAATVGEVRKTLIGHCDKELSLMMPKRIHLWWYLISDIFRTQCVERYMVNLLGECAKLGEFDRLGIDCEVKRRDPSLDRRNAIGQ